MAQIDDLNAAISNLNTEVQGDTDAMKSVVALLDQLHGQLGQAQTAPDLATAVQQVQAARDALAAGRQSLSDALARDAAAAQTGAVSAANTGTVASTGTV